jgi:hypothetical protein
VPVSRKINNIFLEMFAGLKKGYIFAALLDLKKQEGHTKVL